MALIASLVLAVVVWLRQPKAQETAVIRSTPAPLVEEVLPKPAVPIQKVVKRRARKPEAPKESNVMRIQTEDPDVLLIFITDGGEE